jgi:hypothetical protein
MTRSYFVALAYVHTEHGIVPMLSNVRTRWRNNSAAAKNFFSAWLEVPRRSSPPLFHEPSGATILVETPSGPSCAKPIVEGGGSCATPSIVC